MTGSPEMSILVVDDEIHICKNCLKILKSRYGEVEYALNGFDALQLMASNPFDIVITDLNMERLGGMEVIARINDTFPETIVIVMTGYASVSSAVEVMKMGVFDYLPKPFTPYELRAVVQQAVERKKFRSSRPNLSAGKPKKYPTSSSVTALGYKRSFRWSRRWRPQTPMF